MSYWPSDYKYFDILKGHVMTAKTATPMVSRAIEKWRACGLTPIQIRSELESLARKLETDRARLIEALRNLTQIDSTQNGGIVIGPHGWAQARSLLLELEGK